MVAWLIWLPTALLGHTEFTVRMGPLLFWAITAGLIVGVLVGILAAIMGVGGGFIMVPAMIYLLGMPTKVVVGTSLFQIIFVTAYDTEENRAALNRQLEREIRYLGSADRLRVWRHLQQRLSGHASQVASAKASTSSGVTPQFSKVRISPASLARSASGINISTALASRSGWIASSTPWA